MEHFGVQQRQIALGDQFSDYDELERPPYGYDPEGWDDSPEYRNRGLTGTLLGLIQSYLTNNKLKTFRCVPLYDNLLGGIRIC